MHCLAETQPSALPALAPAPGLDNKLHHIWASSSLEHEAVSPPSSTGPTAKAPYLSLVWQKPRADQGLGTPGRGHAAFTVTFLAHQTGRLAALPDPLHFRAKHKSEAWRAGPWRSWGGVWACDSGGSASPGCSVGIQSCPTCVLDSCWLLFLPTRLF